MRVLPAIVVLLMPLSVPASTLALKGGTWIDEAGKATREAVIIVEGSRISAAGPASRIPVPRGARVIDTRGLWIVPGFADNHVHLGAVKADPWVWARAGVTTLVENGSSVPPTEVRKRYAAGPRVEACGPIITAAGGYPTMVQRTTPSLEVSGAADAARKTAALIERERPDCIKIAIERGFLSDLNDEGWPALEESEVRAIVKTAQARGLSVRAHVTQQAEFDLAVAAGVDVIAHAPIESLPDAALQRAARRGVVMVSTTALWQPDSLRIAATRNLVRYVRNGGRIAIGSDYPNWRTPGLPIAELRGLEAEGLTPSELLIALTRNTAGTEERAADFVVLRSDPLQSIDALEDVVMVIRGGKIIYPSD